MSRLVRVSSVELAEKYSVWIDFSNGERKLVDLQPYLRGPAFAEIRQNPKQFGLLAVDAELGTLVWPNGADIDPDVLYGTHVPAWLEAEQQKAVA